MDSTLMSIEVKSLSTPSLDSVREALESGLSQVFSITSVTIVDCPDLTEEPWGLAACGLGGRPQLLHVGGVPYLVPLEAASAGTLGWSKKG